MVRIQDINVSNMTNSNDREVPNQFEIIINDGGYKQRYFQSYGSIIAYVSCSENGYKVYLSEHWNYSTTTTKYLNKFLNTTSKDIKQRIETGKYLVTMGIDGYIEDHS